MSIVKYTMVLVIMSSFGIWPAFAENGKNPDEKGGQKEMLYLDLQDAVELGLDRNHRIQAADHVIEKSSFEVKSVRGRFLPSLSAGYNWTYLDNQKARGRDDPDYLDQNQETWRVSLQQTLFAGKTIVNSYQRAKMQVEASQLEKRGEERELIRKIQEQFLMLLKAKEDQRSLEHTVERLEVGKNAAESFASRQMLPYVEVLQAKVELQEAKQKLSKAKNEVTIHETRLNAMLNLDDSYEVFYAGELADINLRQQFEISRCIQDALENRTDLKYIEKRIGMVDKEKSIALGRKMPRVSLEMSAIDRTRDYDNEDMFQQDQRNQYWTAGVNVEWQIFSGGEQYYRYKGIDREIKRFESLRDDTASAIRTEVRSAYLRLEEARQRVSATRSNLETAREGYAMEEERLDRRIGTIQALLNAQDRLTRSDANLNQALLDYQRALADLYFAMGVKNYALQ